MGLHYKGRNWKVVSGRSEEDGAGEVWLLNN